MQSWLPIVTLIGLAVVAVLVWLFLRQRRRDVLDAIMKKKAPSSKLVGRAEVVEAVDRVPVIISLTDTAFYYENEDVDASFDLDRIDEVEYDDELATGKSLAHGCRALRLRSHGATFEFVIEPGDCERWMKALPPRRMGDEPLAAAQ